MKSKNGEPFYVVVIDQDSLDMGKQIEYKLADKYGNFTGNKRINIVENSLLHKENISLVNKKKYYVFHHMRR